MSIPFSLLILATTGTLTLSFSNTSQVTSAKDGSVLAPKQSYRLLHKIESVNHLDIYLVWTLLDQEKQ